MSIGMSSNLILKIIAVMLLAIVLTEKWCYGGNSTTHYVQLFTVASEYRPIFRKQGMSTFQKNATVAKV